jgi:hypothetical protein
MPCLDKNLFSGQHGLDSNIREKECRNFSSDIDEILKEHGWDGSAAGCIGLKLTADNSRIENGVFITRGCISEEWVQISAKKIWPDVNGNITLFIRFPKAEIFNYSDGGLASDITAQEDVEHGLFVTGDNIQPTPVLEASYGDYGIGEFSLRMLCTLSKNSSAERGLLVKYTILLYPECRQHLLDNYELAQSPAWPGVKVTEGEFPMLPKPLVRRRCPVNPLIMPGMSFADTLRMPAPDDVRAAIAAIMSRNFLPETGRTGAAVLAKWRKIGDQPDELVAKPGPVSWPSAGQMQQEQGKMIITKNFFFQTWPGFKGRGSCLVKQI